MTSLRMLVTCGVVAAVVTLGGAGVSVAAQAGRPSPMAGPLEKQAKPLTPENPVPRRVNYEPAPYPVDEQTGARGSVTVMITLDEAGRIAEARVARTSLMLSNPAVSMTLTESPANDERFLVNRSVEQSNAVKAVAKAFREAALQSVQQWRYDPPADAPIAFPVTVSFAPPGAPGGAAAGRQSADVLGAEDAPVRVGGSIGTPTRIRHVNPAYPPEAQAARITGLVVLEAIIGRDGRVTDVKVLRSVPLLDQAAIDAVLQWGYTPTLLNGVPVPVIMTVTVTFSLK